MTAARFGTLSPDDPRHGKASSYTNHACRCAMCTAAMTAARARHRALFPQPTVSGRRRRRADSYGYDTGALDRQIRLERRLLSDIERRVAS